MPAFRIGDGAADVEWIVEEDVVALEEGAINKESRRARKGVDRALGVVFAMVLSWRVPLWAVWVSVTTLRRW